MTIFDILDNIIKYKSVDKFEQHILSTDFDKIYNMYMIHRWLSMSTHNDIIFNLTMNQHLLDNIKDKKIHYNILLKIIPQHKISFLKYIK